MKAIEVKAVLVDIDDCILPTDGEMEKEAEEGLYSGYDAFRRTFLELHKKGVPVGFCTGRDRNYVEAIAFATRLVRLVTSWSVIESGIVLFNPATKELRLNPALTPAVLKAFKRLHGEMVPRILEKFPQLFEYQNLVQITFERNYGVRDPIEIFFEAVKAELRGLEDQGLLKVRHSKIAIDISPVGPDRIPIDKAAGTRFYAATMGVELSQILGIGDSPGDFPMMELVGQVGCPSNAQDACKELVRRRRGHVSLLPYGLGVTDVIRHFIES